MHPGPDVVTDAGLRVEEVRSSLDQVGVYVVVVPVDWESRRGLRQVCCSHPAGHVWGDGEIVPFRTSRPWAWVMYTCTPTHPSTSDPTHLRAFTSITADGCSAVRWAALPLGWTHGGRVAIPFWEDAESGADRTLKTVRKNGAHAGTRRPIVAHSGTISCLQSALVHLRDELPLELVVLLASQITRVTESHKLLESIDYDLGRNPLILHPG